MWLLVWVQEQIGTLLNKVKGSGSVKTGPIVEFEVTTYDDFVKRSVVGDNLEGQELWQHANMKENGFATTRLSTEASKNNLVIAVNKDLHKEITAMQNNLNTSVLLPYDNILVNAKILTDVKVSPDIVKDIFEKALEHMKNVTK